MNNKTKKVSLGVDFGTSNSSVGAIAMNKLLIFEPKEGFNSQPSSIFIRADGYHSVGFQAQKDFHDENVKVDTYHYLPSVKPGLPLERYEGNLLISNKRELSGKNISKFFTIEELSSFLIKKLKILAENSVNQEITRVVIGRPVFFSEDKQFDQLAQQRLEEAASMVGFNEIQFIMEPVAAALHYEKNHSKPDQKKVLVFDFGGGTLDTCILVINSDKSAGLSPDKLNNRVLSSNGIYLGGADLDKDLFNKYLLEYFGSKVTWSNKHLPMPANLHADITEWHLIRHLDKRHIINFLQSIVSQEATSNREAINRLMTLISEQQVYDILKKIELTKIQLSESEIAMIKHRFHNIDINKRITRKEFESAIISRKREIEKCVRETLKKAQLGPKDIDVVIRVGGSSNNQFTNSLLSKIFDRVESPDIFTSVVAGLSIAANEVFC